MYIKTYKCLRIWYILKSQIKHPIDFTNLTFTDADTYINRLEGMKNELSEV